MDRAISAVVVMGVAGSGKTSVGKALAERIGGQYVEGDAFHPAANVEKMTRGIPLTDDDRSGWLDSLAAELVRLSARGERPVLACSALKLRYRDRLRKAVPSLGFVFLDVTRDEALARMASRAGHFMPTSLVDSQFAALERPAGEPATLPLAAALPLDAIVDQAAEWCGSLSDAGRAFL
ncbi:gluconokinase [Trinickia caryophylli]|uniref:Gluconokinase n=1 Tax=Trinickia caryophylli TaxID=28094 RepID=A0A1X7CET6_TRICW|nr:gluconokinase [Trinickia caryophylli]PMS12627.1 gluconokinase [Trinickia caryophylli]TRX19774.1 gluconokinase [Trinickia caryophylli]WQE12903.1 gluconokinase [Trinickia caryophylli]SME94998.1 gluconate kinase, SKI family [Trinickia caryophylli]GLU30628.1 gluconokinase [Trinickia caryophylli]